jgi:hypothetical protein
MISVLVCTYNRAELREELLQTLCEQTVASTQIDDDCKAPPEWLAVAQATLHRVDAPDLLVEFGEGNAQANGTSCVALYELLVGFGHKLYRIGARRKRLIPVPQEYQNDNLLATKNIEQVCRRTGYTCAWNH